MDKTEFMNKPMTPIQQMLEWVKSRQGKKTYYGMFEEKLESLLKEEKQFAEDAFLSARLGTYEGYLFEDFNDYFTTKQYEDGK